MMRIKRGERYGREKGASQKEPLKIEYGDVQGRYGRTAFFFTAASLGMTLHRGKPGAWTNQRNEFA
jgi:hypothetical protein